MKIAVSARGPALSSEIDPRFGRASHVVVVDSDTGTFWVHDNSHNMRVAHGAGVLAARDIVAFGAEALITGNLTPAAASALKARNIKVYKQTWGTVRDGIERFKSGRLPEVGPTCSGSSAVTDEAHLIGETRRDKICNAETSTHVA